MRRDLPADPGEAKNEGYGTEIAPGCQVDLPTDGPSAAWSDDAGPRQPIVQGLLLAGEGDHEEAKPEKQGAHALTDPADEGPPIADLFTRGPDDLQSQEHLPERLASPPNEQGEVARDNQDDEEPRSHRLEPFQAGLGRRGE